MFAVVFAILVIYTLSVSYVLFWTFYNSFKARREFYGNMIAFPKKWLFSNYTQAFEKIEYNDTSFFGMFLNSAWYSLGMSVLGAFMSAVTGYIFAKYKFRGKEAAIGFILFTIIIPIVGSLPSFYNIVDRLRLRDSPLFLITGLGGFGGNFLILYAFYKTVDWAYAEAAQIDGAGRLYIFFRIMLPFAAGPLFAVSILGFIAQWNNYETPLLFLDKLPTLSSGLYRFSVSARFDGDHPTYLAGVLMSTVPVIALVSVFGNKIIKNMTIGGLKG